jgi:2-polyprenyl-3-methyl-5-hydroxy-6-metoxy-1,4-benzoquinol methylase
MCDADNKITQDYYKNATIQDFYLNVWGGENIHIGIYDKSDIDILSTKMYLKDTIKNACNKKSLLIVEKIMLSNSFNDCLNVADFGAGFGGTARNLANTFKLLKKKYNIDCYDISDDNCEVNKNKSFNDNNINIYNRSFTETEQPNDYYDVIISEDAFIHINDKSAIFKEINRILKPGGLLIFSDIIATTNNRNDLKDVYERININSIADNNTYLKLFNNHNLKCIDNLDYKNSMLIHYNLVKKLANILLEENDDKKKILSGVYDWIKHVELNNITSNLFICKKII